MSKHRCGKHRRRGWWVSQPGEGLAPVGYPSRARAKKVAKNLQGGTVAGSGCLSRVVLFVLLAAAFSLLLAARL